MSHLTESNKDYLLKKIKPLCGAKLREAVFIPGGAHGGFISLYLDLPNGRTGVIDIMGDEERNCGGWPDVAIEPW